MHVAAWVGVAHAGSESWDKLAPDDTRRMRIVIPDSLVDDENEDGSLQDSARLRGALIVSAVWEGESNDRQLWNFGDRPFGDIVHDLRSVPPMPEGDD
jgi:hypothetical protein